MMVEVRRITLRLLISAALLSISVMAVAAADLTKEQRRVLAQMEAEGFNEKQRTVVMIAGLAYVTNKVCGEEYSTSARVETHLKFGSEYAEMPMKILINKVGSFAAPQIAALEADAKQAMAYCAEVRRAQK